MKIPAGEVAIKRVWMVDCAVCCEAVEPDAPNTLYGGFPTAAKAAEAKRNHLEEHARGEWG
jgi:hypothetical protein